MDTIKITNILAGSIFNEKLLCMDYNIIMIIDNILQTTHIHITHNLKIPKRLF